MNIFGLLHLFHATPAPAFQAVPLACAYACMTCKFVIDGTNAGHCKRCGSGSIFRVRSVLDRVVSPLRERLQEQEQKRARPPQQHGAEQRKRIAANPTAYLTGLETPKDAA